MNDNDAMNDGNSLFTQACELMDNNNYIDAIPLLEKASELGHVDAMSNLAIIFLEFSKTEENTYYQEKGMEYLSESASRGNPISKNYLGELALEGRFVQKNIHSAFALFKMAAETGYPYAILNLAKCYELGLGTKVDKKSAINCYYRIIHNDYNENEKELARKRLENIERDCPGSFSDKFTSLMEAARTNDIDETNILLSKEIDIDEKDHNGYTPLIWAVINNSYDVAKVLIESGADINAKIKDGSTPLIMSCESGFLDMTKLLIEKGANIEQKNLGGVNPLGAAAAENNIDIIKYLVKAGANINAKGSADNTPLGWAAFNNSLEAVKILIDLGSDLEIKSSLGYTPLYLAVNGQSLESFKYLIEHGANINEKDNFGDTILINAVRENFIEGVKILLDYKVDASAKNNENKTAMMLANEFELHEIIDLFDKYLRGKTMFCNQCGKEITEDSRFCSFCGHPVKKEECTIINDKNHKTLNSNDNTCKSFQKEEDGNSDEFKEELNFLSDKFKLFPSNTTYRSVFSWKSSFGERVWSDAVYLGKKNEFDISKLTKALALYSGESQEYTEKDIVDNVRYSIKGALQDYNKKSKGDLFLINLIFSFTKDKFGNKKIDRAINCIIEINGINGKYNYITGRLFKVSEE